MQHYWLLLFAVSLCDLREQRIPNFLLVVIIITRLIELTISFNANVFVQSVTSAFILFGIGLFFFFLRAMSPGDVKLLFVVGFITATPDVSSLLFWLLMGGGLVAFFYYFFHRANLINSKGSISNLGTADLDEQSKGNPRSSIRYGNKLVMPFAPSVMIGMAMFYYFN
ncbi:hypothetical protein A6E01_02895 [Vibrio breoganii]|uniref:Prepilin type IV endopeptidase peptidase domain-containing protein n=1 Tax=Vibrio breoganii TaxID=553239 RepID=A0AAN0XT72_9VIBR|nr:A24 family peptidase [Vibrio breoganii]ANO32220.1 hypothetical protein A6E01_02895 [Vibrio breoganii]PMO33281.1 hypothetical protein BCT12_15955 [Vibrio breoganii]